MHKAYADCPRKWRGFFILIREGSELPTGYGVSYRDWKTYRAWCCPMPFNLLVGWGRAAVLRMKIGYAREHDLLKFQANYINRSSSSGLQAELRNKERTIVDLTRLYRHALTLKAASDAWSASLIVSACDDEGIECRRGDVPPAPGTIPTDRGDVADGDDTAELSEISGPVGAGGGFAGSGLAFCGRRNWTTIRDIMASGDDRRAGEVSGVRDADESLADRGPGSGGSDSEVPGV